MEMNSLKVFKENFNYFLLAVCYFLLNGGGKGANKPLDFYVIYKFLNNFIKYPYGNTLRSSVK